ncbi:MAG: MMPL family transporter [Planctomycetes bacterium]|jgi:hopanoid biosynthesis associated RND transporter like protein HpnN|nr:MMPL family transporter [Planctomycetota bacterium]MCL4729854.1 MMPL family transporter [Planctomycetota bacterium]
MSESAKVGRRQRALMALAQFVCRHALWLVIAGLLLAAGSVALTVARLKFITDRNALVDPESDFNRRFLQFTEAFGDQELMLLMVAPAPGPEANPGYHPPQPSARTRAQMKQAAAAIAADLRQHPELFPTVLERVPPDSFGGTRMLYLPRQDIDAIAGQVRDGAPLLRQVAQDPGFVGLVDGLRANIEESADGGDTLRRAREGGRSLADLLKAMRVSLNAPRGAPGMDRMFVFESSDPAVDEDGYLFLWQGRVLFVPILPRKDAGALNQVEEPLRVAREIRDRHAAKYPELAIGLTGRPVIYSDEMASSSRDMMLATLLAIAGVGLMFVAAFRSVLRPLLAVLALVLALCWTIGATTLLIGHLNIFAMVFGVVLVGLGIDFGIHLLSHYRTALSHGLTVREALVEVYGEIGMGTVLGALTTAVALSTAALTEFLGLAELGLICGLGILMCLAAMLVVFPAMLVLVDARRVGEGNPALRQAMRAADGSAPPAPVASRLACWIVVALMVSAIGAAAVQTARGWVPFDYNLLELNDPSARGVAWERLLIRHDQRASYAVSIRPTLEELAELRRRYEPLRERGLVGGFDSMVPEDEQDKRASLGRLRGLLPAQFAPAPVEPTTAARLRAATRRLQAALQQLSSRGPEFGAAFAPALEEAGRLVDDLRQRPGHIELRVAEIEKPFFDSLARAITTLRRDCDPPPVTTSSLPPMLRPRYVGKAPDGRELHALYIYPARDVWQHDVAGEFNAAILAIDPHATGVTVQIHESGNLIVRGFALSVLYAFVAIVVLLFADLRRPLAVLVAMLPLAGSIGILLGTMTVTGLHFNFANFFAVPILIGISVDAGVYMVHSQRHGDPKRTVAATRKACVLCGLTTLLGFGTLVIASHRGIVSLGQVLAVGCVAGVAVSYFVVPRILAWFNDRGRRL